MKKFIATFALLISIASLYNNAEAQNINVNINIGNQPAWGPIGYDYAGYYYFPDIDVYYNVNTGFYNYFDRGRWVSARYLPYAYANYDLYGLYKVVLNVNTPWLYNNIHRRDYARYRGYRGQVVIRDSRDTRYYNSRNNRVRWYSPNNRPAIRDNRYDYERDYNRPNDKRYYDNSRNNNNNKREQNRYNGNNNRPNNNMNSRPGYNGNSRPSNQNNNNRPQRNESVRKNNNTGNEKNQTRNSYSSIKYSENRTNNSVGRGR